MNILFFTLETIKPTDGISKKILNQKKALEQLGHKVYLSNFEKSPEITSINVNKKPIISKDNKLLNKLKWKYDKSDIAKWIKDNKIDLIYIRYTQFADPSYVFLLRDIKKMGVTILFEIPTYPYDKEATDKSLFGYLNRWIEKICRKHLVKYVNRIVTFSNDEYIWGTKTIQIFNGVDPETLPLKHDNNHRDQLHLIGVASILFWHGYDRVIEGLKEYYQSGKKFPIYFHVVGGNNSNKEFNHLVDMVNSYNLQKYVIFHGELYGKELNDMFDKCDVGIGSLGRHRSGVYKFQSLKNVEYGVRGIPFIYSENSDLFDNEKYVFHCSADDTPIPVISICDFYKNLNMKSIDIRNNCISKNIDWVSQFKKIYKDISVS